MVSGGFHEQHSLVLQGLVNRSIQHCRMRGANCIYTHGHALPVPPNHFTEEFTRLRRYRFLRDGRIWIHIGPYSSSGLKSSNAQPTIPSNRSRIQQAAARFGFIPVVAFRNKLGCSKERSVNHHT